MEKKKVALVITLIVFLALCIAMMVVALLTSEKTFGQISAYIAIACVVLGLVGMVILIRFNAKEKKEYENELKKLEQSCLTDTGV